MKFDIGQKVTFLRTGAGNQVIKGEGVIKAFTLDHSNYRIAHVAVNDQQTFGVVVNSLNYTKDYEEKYKAGVAKIAKLEKEGRAKANKIAIDYNNRIALVNTELAGQRVVINVPKAPEPAESAEVLH